VNTAELIARKQSGGELSDSEIDALVADFTAGVVPDYQMSALLMAGYFTGFNEREGLRFLDAMIRSGERWSFSDIAAPIVDKHSTGGVGDKTSLIIAPVVALAGVAVPMISGRALGHTGGTLDKLESIPGLRVKLSRAEFARVLRQHGCAFGAQTENLVPADRKLYALRDVTATVSIPPLIAASILSKKIAEGTNALVMDVKLGPGGFLRSDQEARELAERIVRWSREHGVRAVAFGTDMHEPLGVTVGNLVEIQECCNILRTGEGNERLIELCVLLGGAMLWLADKAKTLEQGKSEFARLLKSGRGWEKFRNIAEAQGARPDAWSEIETPFAPCHVHAIVATRDGFIADILPREIGLALIELGAGRKTAADKIDPVAGLILSRKRGDRISQGDVVAHAQWNHTEANAVAALERLKSAFVISDELPATRPLHYFTIE